MKFGKQLASRMHEPWRPYYMDYNTMKIGMKERQISSGWSTSDEIEFTKKLESELVKVYQFLDERFQALSNRLEGEQTTLNQLMANPKATKRKYDIIADQLTEIIFENNDLTKFLQENKTAFEKMLKKHDRYTRIDLTTHFHQNLSTTYSLDKLLLKFDVLLVKISDLMDICHLRGNPRKQHSNSDQTNFERATAKYWIHPDHITEVKSIILYHLPVHVFNKNKQYEESDMAVSSVYYDNDQFDLYHERLNRGKGAEAIRLRWYGPVNNGNDDIFVERKTHKASWLQGKSVKDRFRIKESKVNDFTSGKYTADHISDEIRKKNKKDVENLVKENHFIASGVQKSIKQRRLTPKCRVFYNRTAFQLPGDQRLRISLDCNLTFIKEVGRESVSPGSKQLNWRRNDIAIDYPFRNVAQKDISRFPYAILETKLQTHLGQKPPSWLTSLVKSHLVYEVPRFSKYIHGAAMLFQEKIPLYPYWLPTFHKDIRRPPVGNIGLSRSMTFEPLVNGHHRQSLMLMYEKELKQTKTPISKSKSLGDFFASKRKPQKEDTRPHLSINLVGANESNEKEGKQIPHHVFNFPPADSNKEKQGGPASAAAPGSPQAYSTKQGKKKFKKIEPKTFFANERTFISWLQFCALLLTVALSLLNNGDKISRIIGAVFIIIASCMCIYALVRYQTRAYQLRTNKEILRYDDLYGPTVLCVVLVTALMVNFYLRLPVLTGLSVEMNEHVSMADTFDN